VPRVKSINDGIELTRRVFDECFFDEEGCEIGLRALSGYEWTYDELHKTTRRTPAHNWASNGADAFRQFAQGYRKASSWKQQAAKAGDVAGHAGRKYAEKRSRRGTLINPNLEHVV
jgi:phage terminase large subunit